MNHLSVFVLELVLASMAIVNVNGQCPWTYKIPDLVSTCLCATNLARQLSIQCDLSNFSTVLKAIESYANNTTIDLLNINNSTISYLQDDTFKEFQINNLKISRAKLTGLSPNALFGQRDILKNLNLQENYLDEIPKESLRLLTNLTLLDLSLNRIKRVSNHDFETLNRLTTLKLSENNLTIIEPNAFFGLENSLKNLNLRSTNLKEVPDAIHDLSSLTFLDLSQNSLQELPNSKNKQMFQGLKSLMALNLERNLIQTIAPSSFMHVQSTLNSLSLLNNLLANYPAAALKTLTDLRVLDIGFNLITEIPNNAFVGNRILTLLALDGNPLLTLPYNAFVHLNGSLKGLSLGGRVLHCDCHLKWILEWIHSNDLQVTSREVNPKFCGTPTKLRDRNFYSLQNDDLVCSNEYSEQNDTPPLFPNIGIGTAETVDEELIILPSITTLQTTRSPQQSTAIFSSRPLVISSQNSSPAPSLYQPSSRRTTFSPSPNFSIASSRIPTIASTNPITTTATFQETSSSSTTSTTSPSSANNEQSTLTPRFNWKNSVGKRPNLVTVVPYRNRASATASITTSDSNLITVKNAFVKDDSVVIQWTTESFNILGFRVIYRLFGDKSFTQGPPLDASEREFKIKNVPAQECFIVCIITLDDIQLNAETIPRDNCREIRTPNSLIVSNLDKITIATSAAICGTIVIAVIIFLLASKRRTNKLAKLHKQKFDIKSPMAPISGMPVNQAYLSSLTAFGNQKEWDQNSGYSNQSIPRARMYSSEQPCSLQEDLRSHYGTNKNTNRRSVADGQSQYSFSTHSNRYPSGGFSTNLASIRQDLRHSRQSLTLQADRLSRIAQIPQTHTMMPATKYARPRPHSNEQHHQQSHHHHHHRQNSRYSLTGSSHTLNNNYCEQNNSDNNWTDHDMDVYMSRNSTRGGALVPL